MSNKKLILDYVKTREFWVRDVMKTTNKYKNYKNDLYKEWVLNKTLDFIKQSFLEVELVQLLKPYTYEFDLLKKLPTEKNFKSIVRELHTYAKHKFYNALIWIVQYQSDCTDAEAKSMATRIYMSNYVLFNKYMKKEFHLFIKYMVDNPL